MREYLLKQYTELSPESTIIGHHSSVHFRNFFTSMGFIVLFRGIYQLVAYFFPGLEGVRWMFTAMVFLIYLRFLFQFLDLYLDALIIDENGATIFLWNKVFNYSIQHSHRDHIEDVQQSQRNFSDKIFAKGNITITLNNGKVIRFAHVAHPKQVTTLLRDHKVRHESSQKSTSEQGLDTVSSEKFEILVETLGEVIKDYMGKDKPDRPEEDYR